MIKPIPQYYNPVTDEYQVLQGENGAARHVLYGSDGNPISTDDNNKLAVRAAEIEAKQDTLIAKDFATQTTLAEVLAKIITSPATEAKQTALEALVGTLTDTAVNDPTASGAIIALLKGLITQMQGDGASGKSMPVQLSGSNMDLRGTAATKPLATAVTIGATYWSVDTDPNADVIEVSNGTNWVVI